MTQPARAVDDGGSRKYDIGDGTKYDSVTSILSCTLPKQAALVPWAAKVVAETAVEVMQDILEYDNADAGYLDAFWDIDEGNYDWDVLADTLKKAHEWERDAAGDRGNEVHDWLERLMKASGGDPGIFQKIIMENDSIIVKGSGLYRSLNLVHAWLAQNDVKVIDTEFTVVNDTHRYAGSCDLVAIVNGEFTFIDYKTSNNVYPETALQLSAYAHGEYVISDDGSRMPMHTDDESLCGMVLHIKPNILRVIDFDIGQETFDTFTYLCWLKRNWMDDKPRLNVVSQIRE